MQAIQSAPLNQVIVPVLHPSTAVASGPLPKAPIEAKRVDRGLPHYGPLPGERFADEAKFGSFS